jgi:hypothetical protein
MNRCTPRLLCTFALAASTALVALAPLPAHAQTAAATPNVRNFPAAALRGEMVVVAAPAITMDGKADRLSPGARIHGTNNMLVMSGALVNQTVVVNYLRESAGMVHEVWILNSEEIAQKRPNSKSSFWIFNFGNSGGSVGIKSP